MPRTVWTVALNVLALVAVLWLLATAWTVITWVLVALFLALAAQPLVSRMEQRGVRRGGAVLVVFLVGFGLVSLLVMTLVPMLLEQGQALAHAAPDYIEKLKHQQWVQNLIQRRTLHMNPLLIALVMLLGTSLAGLVGALLSLPIAGAVQVLLQDRLERLNEQWRTGKNGVTQVILAPEDQGPREQPPDEPPLLHH
jgi:predicted PurR-regulated permease PerM